MKVAGLALRRSLIVTVVTVAASGCGSPQQGGDSSGGADAASVRSEVETWFTDVTEAGGIDFRHGGGEPAAPDLAEIMGSGVAVHDFDGDGRLDVYFVGGGGNASADSDSRGVENRLFLQREPGRFIDATAGSGLGDEGWGKGVAVGDVDNDGDPDVYLTNIGPDELYLNRGQGRFERWTDEAGLEVDGWSSSAAFFDYDRDGLLDLYVARYVVADARKRCYGPTGSLDYCSPRAYEPASDVLLHGEGHGRFRDVSRESGIAARAAAGLGVVVADFDDDGWTDVAVANDGYENLLWLNQGDGSFEDAALVRGIAYNDAGAAEAGMGILAADLDDDGRLDLFLTHLGNETNTFYRGLEAGRGFADSSAGSGLGAPSLSFTGFGAAAIDLELDGDLDVLIGNGRVNLSAPPWPGAVPGTPLDLLAEPNLLLVNQGRGRFREASPEAGEFCSRIEVTRGLATGDLDGDGDLDVVVANLGSPARIHRNDSPRRGHWLQVRAIEPRWGRDATGARVTISAGGRTQVRALSAASSYLSSSEPIGSFGLGSADALDWVEARWPDGEVERFAGGPVDRLLVLRRGEGFAPP